MPEGEKKKDILKDVLAGLPEEPIPGLDDLAQLIYRVLPSETHATTSGKSQKKIPRPKKLKKKTTHYLSEDIFETLGDAKEKLAEMLVEIPKMRISKSRIVNQALEMILREFDQKGEESQLVQRILKRSPEGK